MHQDWLDVPSIRRVASQGWDIRRCYTSSPQCIPARASWITGLRPGQLGVTSNKIFTLPSDSPSFVRQLRDVHGYHTRLIGKTHWTPHEKGVDLRDNWKLLCNLGFDSLSVLVKTSPKGTLFSASHSINSRSIFCTGKRLSTKTKSEIKFFLFKMYFSINFDQAFLFSFETLA